MNTAWGPAARVAVRPGLSADNPSDARPRNRSLSKDKEVLGLT